MNAPERLPLASPAVPVPSPHWVDDGFMPHLGPPFSVRQPPQALPSPHWVATSGPLAAALGWGPWLESPEALALLAGNAVVEPGPWASAYSGHQFGVWAGQLGDGRALLLGEARTPLGRVEVQLKGSGLTPYSRMGDGRAVLRSSVREFLCSEAMHALGIPTTRALAVVGSPAPVRREEIETAAVVTRVAASFLRFGHYEHYTHTAQDTDALRRLVRATIERYFPEQAAAADPVAAWLAEVALRTGELIARWQAVGFCHGVMNTDNMSILGLTIDYGPFGFLDRFDPGHICNHSDHSGRYAYARQPQVAFWNLHALAHALTPLFGREGDSDEARTEAAVEAVDGYRDAYAARMTAAWRAKLGLATGRDDDRALIDALLGIMAAQGADFTITWRALCGFDSAPGAANDAVRDLFVDRAAFDAWGLRYRERLAAEGSVDAERAPRMRAVNPKFVLRNHLAETAIRRAREGDFAEVRRLARVLERPFDEQPETEADAGFPPPWASGLEVSCSS